MDRTLHWNRVSTFGWSFLETFLALIQTESLEFSPWEKTEATQPFTVVKPSGNGKHGFYSGSEDKFDWYIESPHNPRLSPQIQKLSKQIIKSSPRIHQFQTKFTQINQLSHNLINLTFSQSINHHPIIDDLNGMHSKEPNESC